MHFQEPPCWQSGLPMTLDLFGRDDTRAALEQRWLTLTRVDLPGVARVRGWPIHLDHCFQRILLDGVCGTVWYDVIQRRPAYRAASDEVLTQAVALGEAALAGQADMAALNRQSLVFRGKR